MDSVAAGDRVQILYSSCYENGTHLESSDDRDTAYWVRAYADANETTANRAIIGMKVGEQKTVTDERVAGKVTATLEVVAIRKAGARA